MKKQYKKTKVLITLGPASSSPAMIERLINRGANCFRVNFSHGTLAEHGATIQKIRAAGKKLGIYPGILCDLQGPKIRTGKTPGNSAIVLKRGSTVSITNKVRECSDTDISINYPYLFEDLAPNQCILINDGAIRMKVLTIDKNRRRITCKVVNTGTYSSHKGVNFPEAKLRVPSLTAKDTKDLDFILDQDINFIALSFVRRAEDVARLVRLVRKKRDGIKVIAKIEKPEAVGQINEILDACDGIMVARGDLGVEVSPYEIAVLQKHFVDEANRCGKMVIVATQMLESMIERPIPTRAEATDVANAIIDGTDAIMLSGETSVGSYPAESVATMTAIARVTEESRYYRRDPVNLNTRKYYPPHSVCEAAGWASRDMGNVPVIIFTASGDTGLYLSKIRNQSRIFAFTPYANVACMMSLAWNITSFVFPFKQDIAELQQGSESILLKARLVKKGDMVVVVSGTIAARGATNFLRVKKIGEV